MNTVLNKKITVIKYRDIIALLCFIAAVIFFCWKAPYSLGFSDESMVISFVHRINMGDSFITDEWHIGQLTGFLPYLPIKAYLLIVGSTEGIILYCRYLFVALQSIVSIVIYWRLRAYGLFSIIAAVIFFLHIPFFTIMGLIHYSMGLAFVVLTGVLMATTKKHSKLTFYLTGVFFACAVLYNPVLVFVYFLYSICMIVYEKNKNKNRRFFNFSAVSFSFKSWLWITIGIFTLAAIFFIFLFSKTSLQEIIKNLPMLFTDPEYKISSNGEIQKLFSVPKTLFEIIKINPYLFAAFSVLMAVITLDKNRIAHRLTYLVISSAVFLAYIADITLSFNFPNYGYWMFPLALLGLVCYILSENKKKDIFALIWLYGLLYSICLAITSDMGFVVASQGLLVSDVASVIFIANIISELMEKDKFKNNRQNKLMLKILVPVLAAALLLQICQEIYIDSDFKFYPEYLGINANAGSGVSIQRDSDEKLNVIIQKGPEKGLKTTSATAKIYNGIYHDLSTIKEKSDAPVLIVGTFPWCYLYLNMPYASFSARLQVDKISTEKQRLTAYYKLHPEKTPKYMYIPKVSDIVYQYYLPDEMLKNIITVITEGYNYTIRESDYGYTVEINN